MRPTLSKKRKSNVYRDIKTKQLLSITSILWSLVFVCAVGGFTVPRWKYFNYLLYASDTSPEDYWDVYGWRKINRVILSNTCLLNGFPKQVVRCAVNKLYFIQSDGVKLLYSYRASDLLLLYSRLFSWLWLFWPFDLSIFVSVII